MAETNHFTVLRDMDIDISDAAEAYVHKYITECGFDSEEALFSYESILMILGMGEYHPDTLKTTPLTDSVYGFDMEMPSLEEGYKDLFEAIERMSGGKITIMDVEFDIDDDTASERWGNFILRFVMNEEKCEYELQLSTDWMDLSVLKKLNNDIARFDSQHRLWCMEDGAQGMIVFYRDEVWVDAFQAATGCVLKDHADESIIGDDIDINGLLQRLLGNSD